MPFFWMLFDQQGSAWVLQAKKMKLPAYVKAEQLGVCNTAFVLALLPLMENWVYPYLDRRGLKPTPLRRMCCGMALAGFAFLISGAVQVKIDNSPEESVFFTHQIPQYLILTIAEIGVSTTGLEFFYEEAPPRMKTASASLFLLTTAVGDLLGGVLYNISEVLEVKNSTLLFFCGMLMFAATGLFIKASVGYQYRVGDDYEGLDAGEDEDEDDFELSLVKKEMRRGSIENAANIDDDSDEGDYDRDSDDNDEANASMSFTVA